MFLSNLFCIHNVISRHMRILHGDGFRLREREEARETVISNLVIIFISILT